MAGNLVGDALLSAAFVSYAGPFTMPFRVTLAIEQWLPDLVQRGIPLSTDWKPMSLIADDRSKAGRSRPYVSNPKQCHDT